MQNKLKMKELKELFNHVKETLFFLLHLNS